MDLNTEWTLDMYISSCVCVYRVVDFQMLLSLLKVLVEMLILVEIYFSMLFSVDMSLPRSRPLTLVLFLTLFFLVLRVCNFTILVFVGCILRLTVSAVLPIMSVFLGCPFAFWKCKRRPMSSSAAKSVSSSHSVPIRVLFVDHL